MEKKIGSTFQVRPSAKCSTLSGHDAHAQLRFLVHPIPDAVKLMMSRIVDAIELFRSIESHEKDVRCRERERSEGCRWCWRPETIFVCH